MKIIKILGLVLLTTVIFASCSKEDDVMDDLIKPTNDVKTLSAVCEPKPPKIKAEPE
jgi:PBP1b-binding outer membrane lipoprotein LpoB